MATNQKAVEQIKPKELTCFIIMPFSEITFRTAENENRTLSEQQLTHIYKKLFKCSVETYCSNDVRFTANRYTAQRGNFVKGIISDLDTADLVIADLTGLNNNVFYELGVRHTLRCGTLMLTQNKKELASDLSNYITIEYKYPEASHEFDRYYPEFEREINNAITEVLNNPDRSDNPVRDFIGDRNIFRNEQRIREIKGNIELMRLIAKEYIYDVNHLSNSLEDWSSAKNDQDIRLYSFNSTAAAFLNRLVALGEKETVVSFVKKLVTDIGIIDYNQQTVSNKRDKCIEACRKLTFGFSDMKDTRYHILDLKLYHNGTKSAKNDPVYTSFEYFIREWKRELEQLMK